MTRQFIFLTISLMLKRLSIIGFLVLAVFFLVACGEQPPDRTQSSYTGTVKRQGSDLVLGTDSDQFTIRSTFLDLTPYVNQKVKMHGQFSQDVFFVDDVKPAAVK